MEKNKINSQLQHKLTDKVNKKTMLSYLFIFLVPFLVLSIYLLTSIYNSSQKEFQSSSLSAMTQFSLKLNETVLQLNKMALDMSENEEVEKPKEYQLPITIDTQKELKRYALLGQCVDGIAISYTKSPYVYTDEGTMNKETFIESYQRNTQINLEELEPLLTKPSNQFYYNGDKMGEHLLYTVPFFSENSIIGTIFFNINTTELKKRIGLNMLDNELAISFYANDVPILSSNENKPLSIRDINTFETWGNVTVNKKKHMVYKEKVMPEVNVSIVGILTKTTGWLMLLPLLGGTVTILFLFLLIGIIFIIYMSYKQNQPLYRLNKVYRELSKQEKVDNNEVVSAIGDYLFNMKLDLEEKAKTTYRLQKDNFYNELIRGGISDATSVTRHLEQLNLNTQEQYGCFIGLTSANFDENAQISLKMKTVLVNHLPLYQQNYTVDYLELAGKQLFCFIFFLTAPLQNNDEKQTVVNQIESDFSQGLIKELGIELNVSFGRFESDIQSLNLSYLSALSRQEMKEKESNDLEVKKEESFLPVEKTNTLIQAVKHGSPHLIEKIVNELFQEADHFPSESNLQKSFEYYIFNELLNVIEHEKVHSAVDIMGYCQVQINIRQDILRLALNLSSFFKLEEAEQESQDENKLLMLIQDNFNEPSFSLDELAEVFDVSLSKMSQIVKKETGYNFSKYVQQLRIEKAKELLIETEKTVKEIVHEVGYSDISNFTRKFRETVGLPPGQFREVNKR